MTVTTAHGNALTLFSKMKKRIQVTGSQEFGLYEFVQKILLSLDIASARTLSQGHSDKTFFTFCHLLASYRFGHMLIECTEDTITPQVDEVWCFQNEHIEDEELVFHHKAALKQAIIQGFYDLKRAVESGKIGQGFVLKENKLFLTRAFECEETIRFHIKRLLDAQFHFGLDVPKAIHSVSVLQDEGKLLKEQANAIVNAITTHFSFMWGGPGTGKTYTAGVFLKILVQALNENDLKKIRIAIAAPTGKATTNLAKSIQKAFSSLNTLQLEIKTIHSLLRIASSPRARKRKSSTLPYDIFVIDESSMIDAELMAELLSRISSGSKVLFIGDPCQLPPVEPGSPFDAMIHMKKSESVLVPHGKLIRCMRSDVAAIATFASCVNAGNYEKLLEYIEQQNIETGQQAVSFHFIENSASSYAKAMPNLLREYSRVLFSSERLSDSNPELLFSHFLKARLLCPLKSGPFGADTINDFLHRERQRTNFSRDTQEPIIVTKNDYELNVCNGEIGVLLRSSSKGSSTVLFESATSDLKGLRKIPLSLINAYDYAYCLSVHKSQGSEFDTVFLFLPPGSEQFGRKMLYTAITRAKKSLVVWTSHEVLKKIVASSGDRLSSLLLI